MEAKLYIKGYQSDNEHIECPLASSAILFLVRYCQEETLPIVFVSDDKIPSSHECCKFQKKMLSDLNISFTTWAHIPKAVKNVSLPSLYEADIKLVRSGLCIVLRHIIKHAHEKSPSLKLIDLLGFRNGSMKMCSEVSGWTKLCEVDLPNSLTQLISTLRNPTLLNMPITLPSDLIKLEDHFMKKCRIHNDDKKRRAELISLHKYFSDFKESNTSGETLPAYGQDISNSNLLQLQALSLTADELYLEQIITLDHGIRKFRVKKKRTDHIDTELEKNKILECSADHRSIFAHITNRANENSVSCPHSVSFDSAFDLSELQDVLNTVVYTDIEYVHVYSEGIEMTVADLILFTYIYHLLETIGFDCHSLSSQLPSIIKWADHMTTLKTVLQACLALGWQIDNMKKALSSCSHIEENIKDNGKESRDIKRKFLLKYEKLNEAVEDMELSRNAKMKHKAIKPEVIQVLNKIESLSIKPIRGSHPKRDAVEVDWDSLPNGAHPKEGGVPLKRTKRKCQQLENLATAIQAIAKPGDVVVDFCSGGGHLGIVLACLLPNCQILLVENKEESLLSSCSRLKSLELTNVSLYQCNMDYFIGKFDVGTCLHACGSATDMVLQLSMKSKASFVICPCCYGSIHNTHLLCYPRSKHFIEANISYKDFLTLGHAADQTEFNIALEEQGRMCMNLIDTDRAHYAKELDYSVSLCSLQPLSCTPKNNLLIGTPI